MSCSGSLQVFLLAGRAMRFSVPIGLNVCPPFHSIARVLRAPSIIPPAKTVIEDETRRNTFWLTYATERLYSSGNGWAMSMDDEDISQLLPVRRDHFEQGVRELCVWFVLDHCAHRRQRSCWFLRSNVNGFTRLGSCSITHQS